MNAVATPTRSKLAKVKPATHQPSSVEREFMHGPPEVAQEAAYAPRPAPDMRPHNLTTKQQNEMQGKMLQASVMLELLIIAADHVDDDYDGMMGTLQFTAQLLAELHMEIIEVDGVLPDDFRLRTFEAHSIVDLVERLTVNTSWDRKSYDSSQLICWFDAANECLLRALRALETVKEAPDA